MTQSIADVLDRAADLIEPEGRWIQGYFGLSTQAPSCCAVGAIGRVAGILHPKDAECWIDENAIPYLGMSANRLELWNDVSWRTQAEVVSKLREAAALARERSS